MARREAGAATAELVVATPVLLMVLLLVVQFALWQHAEHVVTAAAREGARTARLEGGTASAGQARAEGLLHDLGRHVVDGAAVRAERDGQVASVHVEGHAVAVVPFLHLVVRADSSGPVERFRPATEAP